MSEFRTLFASWRRWRAQGLGVVEALAAVAEDERLGADFIGPRFPPQMPAPVERQQAGLLGLATTILINSVTLLGVFRLHWPVGSALALYWAENALTGTLLIFNVIWWRSRQPAVERRQVTPTSDIVTVTIVFNLAHLIFLLLFLGTIVPRVAPAERFDRHSFLLALAVVGFFLLVEFARSLIRSSQTPAAQMRAALTFYLQRIALLHLTIIVGMFGMAMFGQARSFFAVFAALKLFVDLTRAR